MTPDNVNDESYLEERIPRREARQEFYAEISQRLGEKELFILLHLINRHVAYNEMKKAIGDGVESDSLLTSVDDSDTIVNIASATKIHHQYVRTAIYALYVAGLVEKVGMKNNANSWRVTWDGGQVVKEAVKLEGKKKKGLEERFAEKTKKK